MSKSSGARKGWAEFFTEAVEDGRVLSYDKEKGSVLSVIAQHARLGNITEASLNDSISQNSDLSTPSEEKYDLAHDATCMAAVESGDMDAAQRMVDAAAKAAGYDYLYYQPWFFS